MNIEAISVTLAVGRTVLGARRVRNIRLGVLQPTRVRLLRHTKKRKSPSKCNVGSSRQRIRATSLRVDVVGRVGKTRQGTSVDERCLLSFVTNEPPMKSINQEPLWPCIQETGADTNNFQQPNGKYSSSRLRRMMRTYPECTYQVMQVAVVDAVVENSVPCLTERKNTGVRGLGWVEIMQYRIW